MNSTATPTQNLMAKIITFLFVWCWSWHTATQAMTLERVGNDLYATGPTVSQDFLNFKHALAPGDIERLILVNGPGGDLWTGMQVARMVQSAQIKTIVSGHCMSACSLIFMAGRERAFGSGHLPRVTMVGIHGAHSKDTKTVNPAAMPQMYALYKQQMGDKFDSQVIQQALYDIQEAYGFLRIREIQRNQDKDRTPWFCPTGQTPISECSTHPGKDAFTLGVVTQLETETLTLPDSMQIKPTFFGRPLAAPSHDLQERAAAFIQNMCADQRLCKTIGGRVMQTYLASNAHKSLAVGWGKQGYGYRYGADDPGTAMLQALYQCNHARNNPKLCRLIHVNDHEVLTFYDEVQHQVPTLLQDLKVPSAVMAQQERDEPGAHTPNRLRTTHLTGMTPKALEGIRRMDTPDLTWALKQSDRPVVIDVGAAGPMIPGALNFIHGGLAFEDEKKDAAFEARFRQMLQIAAPDPHQPVVFYCASAECWLSVNAAMRAQKIGYTQIMWYRGGAAAWLQSGLPTHHRVPVAILN
ncbi:hypothetical protein B9Z47_13820 [Limnohabitans sp. 2KL-1]|jgi:rhodanese-related sulfurtransferase|nr:hypothetical protein B9Z47_13820 [Limnohabitans sp. 2KL-1]